MSDFSAQEPARKKSLTPNASQRQEEEGEMSQGIFIFKK